MTAFSFIHAADIHLDSPLLGLARRGEFARAFLSASRSALTSLVDEAIARRVAFLVIAGDIFDGDWKDWSTGQAFAREMGRLARAKIPVFMLRGNHDAESVITRQVALPANVHEFATSKPQSFRLEALRVALHGQGFAKRHAQDDIAQAYPPTVSGWFNIGVLHTSLDGRDGHAPYAPTQIEHLRRHGYDYWALGHIHAREIVARDPWIVFPGNLQGRHAKEVGPKGATLVHVENGRVSAVEALTLDAARFDHVELDLAALADETALRALARSTFAQAAERAQGRPLALRVTLAGVSALHERLLARRAQIEEDMQALAAEAGADMMLEKLVLATAPARPRAAAALDGFHEILDEIAADVSFRDEVVRTLASLRAKAPDEVFERLAESGVDVEVGAVIQAALAQLRASLADESEAQL